MSVNKVLLLGRLGTEVELKYTQNSNSVCNFSMATSEKYKDKSGQQQEKTEWHRIVVWGKLAELCNQYIGKGSQVYVEGKLTTRSWETESGDKKYTTEIVANQVQFLGSKNSSESHSDQKEDKQSPSVDSSFMSDDIPF